MTPEDPLAQLKDIIEPAAPGYWPLSLAWWICAIALMLAIWGSVFLFKRAQRPQQKAAKHALLAMIDDYNQHQSAQRFYIELSQLMRRLSKLTSQDSQQLYGDQWLAYLNKTGDTNAFTTRTLELMAQAPYHNIEDRLVDIAFVQQTVMSWVKKNLC